MSGRQKPSTAMLLDWIEHRLPAEDADDLARAIEADPELQAQVDWLRDFLRLSEQVVLVEPPKSIHQQATARFVEYAQGKRPAGLIKTFIAALTSDSWQRLSLAGVRNVTLRTDPRQLIYHSDLADVALTVHLAPSGPQIDVDGQVFPLDDSDPVGFVVQLLQEGVERRLATCDAVGKFSFAGLTAGAYDLVVSSERGEVELGPVELA